MGLALSILRSSKRLVFLNLAARGATWLSLFCPRAPAASNSAASGYFRTCSMNQPAPDRALLRSSSLEVISRDLLIAASVLSVSAMQARVSPLRTSFLDRPTIYSFNSLHLPRYHRS